ncbi:MAG: hypothetical protein JRJ44_09505 [Deltaproteobacteria bacterium]|nr:hypothetical protein [Deltaproteobacteria bacterium]
MTEKIKKDKKLQADQPIELHLNANIKPVWIDDFDIGIREDDICFLRLVTNLPEGVFEQYKIMTNKRNLKEIINSLCSALKYYPVSDDTKQDNVL